MKIFFTSIALLSVALFLTACKVSGVSKSNSELAEGPDAKWSIPKYVPSDQSLHDNILAMDKKFFDAYNSCDLETQSEIISDDMEFYHDLGGLETDKATLIQAVKENICDKVTRQLVAGSMEVYPIAGHGAVSEGYHVFFNKLEPDAPQKPSKFITIWKQTEEGWKMSRIVSLH